MDAILAHDGTAELLGPGDDFEKLSPQGILLTGGGDLSVRFYERPPTPSERKTLGRIELEREEYELKVLAWAAEHDVPVLGICRGCQMMNVFARGALLPDIPIWQKTGKISPRLAHRPEGDSSDSAHDISIRTGSRLYRIFGEQRRMGVNSSHHQALSRCGDSLKVAARSADGIIEAIEDPGKKFWIGVQFHPERMWKRFSIFSGLFNRLVKQAKAQGFLF